LKVEYNEETPVRKSLTFEIESEVVEKAIQDRAREYARKVKLPGFRAGKVPEGVIKQRFRAQVLEDVAEKIVNKVVFQEIEGRGLKPLASPQVVDLKINENEPMTFRAVFETLPIVELPDYRGLRAKSRRPEVKDEQVEQEIDALRENAARYDPVEDRPAQPGDYVLADVASRAVEGGRTRRNENVLVEVGGKDNYPEINEALVNAAPGETKRARVSEPAEGEGQPPRQLDYTLVVKGIKTKVVPAADDDFAKDLGDFGSIAELREATRRRLLANEERRIERETKNALLMALVDKSSMEVPQALVERHMNVRTEQAARGLALQGIDPTKIGVDWRQYRDGQRDDSVRAAKADILLHEIANREGIDVSDLELDAEIARLAERYHKSKEAVRAQLEKEGEIGALRARIREEKVLDLLRATATLDFE
jgi:trigger factor